VGDWVVIKGSGDEPTLGQILELKGKDAVISLGAIRSTIKLHRLQKIIAPKQPKKSTTPSSTATGTTCTSVSPSTPDSDDEATGPRRPASYKLPPNFVYG
jgi:DNA mismatch repair protein MutS2